MKIIYGILLFMLFTSSSSAEVVGNWHFSENAGVYTNDSSGFGNNGILINNPLWSNGKFDFGLDFNGVNSYVDARDGASLNLENEITLEAWIAPQKNVSLENIRTIVDKFGKGNFTNSSSWSFYDTASQNSNSRGFAGAVFDGRYVYFVPYNAGTSGQITRYDTTGLFTDTSSWSFYDTTSQNSNSRGFLGAVFDGRYIYFVPYHSNGAYHGQVTRYDTTGSFTDTSSWSFYDTASQNSNSRGFHTAVFDGRYVYFVPQYNGAPFGQVTRYDTTGSFTDTSSWSFYNTASQNSNSKGFIGAAFDGKYVYFVPHHNGVPFGQVTRYDTTGSFTDTSSWSFYDTALQNSNSKGFAGAVFDGRYVYFVPTSTLNGQVTRYDTTGSFTDTSSWSFYDTALQNSNSKGFWGAVFDGNYIYFVSYNSVGISGQVTRYNTTGSFTDTSSWSFYDTSTQNSNSKGFFGAVFDGKYVYFVPHYNNGGYRGQVTRYDTTGNNASYSLLYGLGQNSYGSTPFGSGIRINTDKGTYSVFDNKKLSSGWHYIVGTYNGSRLNLYIDGNLSSSKEAQGKLIKNSAPLKIGNLFNGSIDEVKIHDYALSSDEIRANYNKENVTTAFSIRYIEHKSILAGGSTNITVTLKSNITQALSLQETLPDGWNLTRISDDADIFKQSTNEWLWFNISPSESKTVVYKLTASNNASIGTYYINGTISDENGIMAVVGGDNTLYYDILSYYRSLGKNPSIVETTDLLKAANDWRNDVIPIGFNASLTTQQLLKLADEWIHS